VIIYRSPIRVLLVSTLLSATCCGQGLEANTGTWKMNAARSTFTGGTPFKSLTVRIERHPKGEVFTLYRIETDGRATNYSTILYLDGEPRRFDDFGCSGIQSSRRADERTVEIVRMCASGDGCGSCGAPRPSRTNSFWRLRSNPRMVAASIGA
jgi:hypothetical protein